MSKINDVVILFIIFLLNFILLKVKLNEYSLIYSIQLH